MATYLDTKTVQTTDGWTSMVFARPVGLAVNAIMHAAILQTSNAADSWAAITPPSGWGFLDSIEPPAGTSKYNKLSVYWKVATAGDVAASTFTFNVATSPTSYDSVGLVIAHTVSGYTSPINAYSKVYNEVASSSIVGSSLTTTVPNTRLIGFFAGGAGTATISTMTAPAGMTERGEVTASGGPYGNLMVADQQLSSSGAVGTRTATYDSGSAASLVILVAINDSSATITGSGAPASSSSTLAGFGGITSPVLKPFISPVTSVRCSPTSVSGTGTLG